MMMRLPHEILLIIAHSATDVAACDTRPGCTKASERASMLFQLRTTYPTKRALCLVSRAAHDIFTPLMYEVVAIYDPERIATTLTSLRLYGRWCRRLELDLVSDGSDWPYGATNLWGTIHACPSLEILNIHIIYTGGVLEPPPSQFNIPLSLLVQIADAYGTRLRRLEFGGDITIHNLAARYLLSRCTALEVLVISGLFVQPPWESGTRVDGHPAIDAALFLSDDHIQVAMPLLSAEEKAIAAEALLTARSVHGSTLADCSPSLPNLHTLDIGDFANLIKDWDLPRLAVLHVSFRSLNLYMLEDEGEDQIAVLNLRGQHLRAVTYSGTGAVYSPTGLLKLLPEAEYFAFKPYELDAGEGTDPPFQHALLREVELCGQFASHTWPWLSLIADDFEKGYLPSLQVCRVLHWKDHIDTEQEFLAARTRFEALGLILESGAGDLVSTPHSLLSQPAFSWSQANMQLRTVKGLARKWPDIVQNFGIYKDWHAQGRV
ncbi:hypothetical protein EXIGLDRAFT_725781 [Exidia glandulosa HHB12029]|uniref:F-box domain-containing protein n=1 Tax=Exidia glandulosa HHB12029 TaxID=1314781 RepID=A0A165QAT1_EXIGL|nr:hypothetical protein EXIGLDRAFT_725781 [Exidia glandulosa HHB12029]